MHNEFDMLEPSKLSAAGDQKREAILRHAMGVASRRRWRRNATRSCGVALLGVIVISVALHNGKKAIPPQIVRHSPQVVRVTLIPQQGHEIVVKWIKTDPTLVDQLAVRSASPTWHKLSDDELLRQLAAAGKPAALAYVDGKAELLWRKEAARLPYR